MCSHQWRFIIMRNVLSCLALIGISVLSACASPQGKYVSLQPIGANLKEQDAIVKFVDKNSLAKEKVKVGYRISKIGNDVIKSAEDAATYDTSKLKEDTLIEFINNEEENITLEAKTVFDFERQKSFVFLQDFEAPFVLPKKVADSSGDIWAVNSPDFYIRTVSGLLTTSPIYAVSDIFVKTYDCKKECKLEDIWMTDQNGVKLSMATPHEVADTMYPKKYMTAQRVAVPGPTISGFSGYTSHYGNFSANTYGNYTSGSYSGNSYTHYTPQYDYSAQTAANAHNFGVAIQQAAVQAQDKAHREFVLTALHSNLPVGKLKPNTSYTGKLFFSTWLFGNTDDASLQLHIKLNGKTYKAKFVSLDGDASN